MKLTGRKNFDNPRFHLYDWWLRSMNWSIPYDAVATTFDGSYQFYSIKWAYELLPMIEI